MADDKKSNQSKKPASKSRGRRTNGKGAHEKRPHAVIDAKVEKTKTTKAVEKSHEAAKKSATSSSRPQRATDKIKQTAHSKQANQKGTSGKTDKKKNKAGGGWFWPLTAIGVLGGGLALLGAHYSGMTSGEKSYMPTITKKNVPTPPTIGADSKAGTNNQKTATNKTASKVSPSKYSPPSSSNSKGAAAEKSASGAQPSVTKTIQPAGAGAKAPSSAPSSVPNKAVTGKSDKETQLAKSTTAKGASAAAGSNAETAALKKEVADLKAKLAAFEAKLGKLETNVSANNTGAETKGLADKISSVSQKANSLENKTKQVEALLQKLKSTSDQNALVAGRIGSLEQTFKALAAKEAGGSGQAGSETSDSTGNMALASRIHELETGLNSKLSDLKNNLETSLEAKIKDMPASGAAGSGSPGAAADLTSLKETTKAVEEKLTNANKTVEALKSSFMQLDQKNTALADKLNQIDGQLKDAKSGLSGLGSQVTALAASSVKKEALGQSLTPIQQKITGLSQNLTKMSDNLSSLKKDQSQMADNAKKSALTIALTALKRDLDNGQPYLKNLEGVKKLAGENYDFSALEAYADKGLPPQEALLKQFSKLAVTAVNQEEIAKAEGWWEKIKANAKTAVKYRSKGALKGDGAQAVLARVETMLTKGDFSGALKEGSQLEGPAKQTLAPWFKLLEARSTVTQTMAGIEKQILNNFAGQ